MDSIGNINTTNLELCSGYSKKEGLEVEVDDKNTLNDIAKSREALVVKEKGNSRLLYSVNECPPWTTCIALGLQHFLMMVESTVSIPYLLTPLMCMEMSDPNRGFIASTIIFVSGLVTVLQTSLGVRLPIVQGGTHGFLGPIFAILSLLPCPPAEELAAMTLEEREETWQLRMRTVQGAICVASLFQIIVGITGAVGTLLQWITPLVITPTVTLIGLSLFKVAAGKAASHWGISALTVALLVIFSQYMGNVAVPFLTYSQGKFKKSKIFIFKLFPVLLALVFSWLLCFILTATDSLDKHNEARTDLRLDIIDNSPWFRIPYPGQWGAPVVTMAGVLGMLAGVLASIVESIGDYYSCARLSGAPPPPTHAINRGIWIEGIGTFSSGLFGTGSGTTSYSQNVGAIGVTGVGSRRVVQCAAIIMILCGVIGKVGALFICIPEPIIGGIFIVVFSMITSVGLSSVQFVNLNSPRNLFVLGFSIFFGIAVPEWMQLPVNKNIIQTSFPALDQVISVLLRTPMFVGGFLGFLLDNTVPGTREERGLNAWEAELRGENLKAENDDDVASQLKECYDFPYGMKTIQRLSWSKYVPVSPTFEGWKILRMKKVFPTNESSAA